MKAPPFALLALRFPTHVYSDKLAWLHRWTGRFIYILTVAHVGLWSVQLATDKRVGINGGGIAWAYAFSYPKFIFGIIVSRHFPTRPVLAVVNVCANLIGLHMHDTTCDSFISIISTL